MGKIFKILFSNFFSSILFIIGIISSLITIFYPNISEKNISVSVPWMLVCVIFLASISWSIYQYIKLYMNKNCLFIEIGKTEKENDVYWFSTNYFLNTGEIIKLFERRKNGVTSFVCVAKVLYINENGHIGLLPLGRYKSLELIKENKFNTKDMTFVIAHINSEDLTTILKQITKDNLKSDNYKEIENERTKSSKNS